MTKKLTTQPRHIPLRQLSSAEITYEVLVRHFGSVRAICEASQKYREPGKKPLTTQNVYAWRSKGMVPAFWRLVFLAEIDVRKLPARKTTHDKEKP